MASGRLHLGVQGPVRSGGGVVGLALAQESRRTFEMMSMASQKLLRGRLEVDVEISTKSID
jgi:hypothetical protein